MTKTLNLHMGLCTWEKSWQNATEEKHIYRGTHPGWIEFIEEGNTIFAAYCKKWVYYTSYTPTLCPTSASATPSPRSTQLSSALNLNSSSHSREATAPLVYLNSWKQLLKFSINKQEVNIEAEKVHLSLGREEQVVSGNRHQVIHRGKLRSRAEASSVPTARLSASVILFLKAPIKRLLSKGSQCLVTKF